MSRFWRGDGCVVTLCLAAQQLSAVLADSGGRNRHGASPCGVNTHRRWEFYCDCCKHHICCQVLSLTVTDVFGPVVPVCPVWPFLSRTGNPLAADLPT